jgi:hypothetical protein
MTEDKKPTPKKDTKDEKEKPEVKPAKEPEENQVAKLVAQLKVNHSGLAMQVEYFARHWGFID